jgi:16S rRNA (guanine966-N2)-methyltransferase|tara:strand:+ start:5292 stop:5855 length:564 start_codon:yes stop_codon:yes gene_type:complete
MRIISGSYKGKKLFQPTDSKTRPLKDLTKESIFNLLIHSKFKKFDLEKSIVLDLFSGSGSFGLECLSRKVKHVTFVENYKPAIRTFYKNIQYLNNIKNYDLIEKDIFDIKIKKHLNKNFDLIFADPPYKEKRISSLFSIIEKNNFLNKNGLLILHRNKKTNDPLNDKFHIINTRFYGISKIIFYKLK